MGIAASPSLFCRSQQREAPYLRQRRFSFQGGPTPSRSIMDRTRMPDERDCRCIKKGTAAQRCYFRGWLVGG